MNNQLGSRALLRSELSIYWSPNDTRWGVRRNKKPGWRGLVIRLGQLGVTIRYKQ